MTLRDYLNVVWHRKWLIIAIVVVATASAYFLAARKTPQYSATASLLYEQPIDVTNPLVGSSAWIDPTLQALDVQSISTVVDSPDIYQRVVKAVGQPMLDVAPYSVSGSAVTDTSNNGTGGSNVAQVTVVSSDPKQAAALANAYALAFVQRRKDHQQEQIKEGEAALEKRLKATPTGTTEYYYLQQTLGGLAISYSTVTGDFSMVTPATPPSAPFAPRPLRSAVLGFGVGLFAAIGLAFLLEQLNTRLRDYREVAEILQLPIVGRIPTIPKKYFTEHGVAVVDHPGSRTAEAFRMLRGNLEFVNVDEDVRSLLVTSCHQGEGKSLTVANLAATLALAGKRVIVIDGDLRRPQIHHYFDLPNEAGLSTVLSGQDTLDHALQKVVLEPVASGGDAGAPTSAAGSTRGVLAVLAAGPETPAPGELIASKKFASLMELMKTRADMVLVDSPAIMAVGDAGALATTVDGMLVLVDIQAIRKPVLAEVRDVIEPMPCRKVGVIVVREKLQASESYRYAYYRYQRA